MTGSGREPMNSQALNCRSNLEGFGAQMFFGSCFEDTGLQVNFFFNVGLGRCYLRTLNNLEVIIYKWYVRMVDLIPIVYPRPLMDPRPIMGPIAHTHGGSHIHGRLDTCILVLSP